MCPARHNRRHFELYSDPSVYSGKNVTLSSIPLDIWTEDSSTTLGTERNLVRTERDNTLNPSLIHKLIRAEWLRNFKVHTEHLIVHKVKSESSIFAALSCPVFAPGFGGRARAHFPEQWLVIEPIKSVSFQ